MEESKEPRPRLRLFAGHLSEVSISSDSADARWRATAGRDGVVCIRDNRSGELLRPVDWRDRHPEALDEDWQSWIRSLAFSPDGETLACADDDAVLLLEAPGGRLIREIGDEGAYHLAWSRDGSILVASYPDGIVAWDATRGETRWRVGLGGGDAPEKFEIQGERILFRMNQEVCALDVREGRWLTRREVAPADFEEASAPGVPADRLDFPAVRFLALPDDRTIVFAQQDGKLRRWRLWPLCLDGGTLSPLTDSRALALSADGGRVAWATRDGMRLEVWEGLRGCRRIGCLETERPIQAACFVPGSEDLVVSEYKLRDGRVFLWSPATRATRSLDEFAGNHRVVGFGPSPATGEVLWTREEEVLGWRNGEGEARVLATGIEYGAGLSVRPDGRFVAIADGRIAFLDRESGRIAAVRSTGCCCSNPLAFSPDGSALAAGFGCANHGLVFEFSRDHRSRLEGHVGSIRCAAFTADGRRVVTGSSDGTIRVWGRAHGRLLATLLALPGEEWVAWTPDDFFVASDGAGRYLRWQLEDEFHPFEEFRSYFAKPGALHWALVLSSRT